MKNNNGEGRGRRLKREGGLLTFFPEKGGGVIRGGGGLKGQVYSSVHAD